MQHRCSRRDGHDNFLPGAIPARNGIGLRAPHHAEFVANRPRVGFLEVHSENFFGEGGAALALLARLRADYALSLDGVGLSLGSYDPLNAHHLGRLSALIARTEPLLVSEHQCWSSIDGEYFNDLLPLPYTWEALAHVSARVDAVQTHLGRQVATGNLSSYLTFAHAEIPKWEFLRELAKRTGCALLLDVNNVYVAAVNHGFDPYQYVMALPPEAVLEIHLAGHKGREINGRPLLIDTHDRPIADAVWDLYDFALRRLGPVLTLIEWDSDLPPLPALVLEARRADCLQETHYELAA